MLIVVCSSGLLSVFKDIFICGTDGRINGRGVDLALNTVDVRGRSMNND